MLQRDYELIKIVIGKHTTKLNMKQFTDQSISIKASTYRKYDRAYFEEIIINNTVEERLAKNYRERFI